jgi:hypothetical protein
MARKSGDDGLSSRGRLRSPQHRRPGYASLVDDPERNTCLLRLGSGCAVKLRVTGVSLLQFDSRDVVRLDLGWSVVDQHRNVVPLGLSFDPPVLGRVARLSPRHPVHVAFQLNAREGFRWWDGPDGQTLRH